MIGYLINHAPLFSFYSLLIFTFLSYYLNFFIALIIFPIYFLVFCKTFTCLSHLKFRVEYWIHNNKEITYFAIYLYVIFICCVLIHNYTSVETIELIRYLDDLKFIEL